MMWIVTKEVYLLIMPEYAGLPVTPLTVASTTIQVAPYVASEDVGAENSSSSTSVLSFVNSLKPLLIDENGDGQTDITAIHDATTTMTTDSYLDILKKMCETLNRQSPVNSYCRDIPKRIDAIKDQLKKGKLKHFKDNSMEIAKHIKHRNGKKLSDADRADVGKMIDEFVGQFEGN